MSTAVSFWKRVGNAFRASVAGGGESNGNGHPRTVEHPEAAGNNGTASGDPSPGSRQPRSSLLPWLRRDSRPARQAEAYERLVGLMDAMQEHFKRQDQRAEQLNGSLDRVAGMLGQVANAQDNAGEHIHSIARQVDSAGKHTAMLSQALCEMPATLQAEADAVRLIARQLEISHEVDTQLMHSLQQFGNVVDALRESGAAQAQTLERLHSSAHEQRQALVSLLKAQGRRFLAAMIVASVIGLGVLAALVIAVAKLAGPYPAAAAWSQ